MTPAELQERTLTFAIKAFKFARPLFRDPETRHIAQQLVRSSTGVAANYRAACLARSGKEWTARIGVVCEEADETVFWLVFIVRSECLPNIGEPITWLKAESEQLVRIFAASYHTSRQRRSTPPRSNRSNDP
jgi:four helix bundle protein